MWPLPEVRHRQHHHHRHHHIIIIIITIIIVIIIFIAGDKVGKTSQATFPLRNDN